MSSAENTFRNTRHVNGVEPFLLSDKPRTVRHYEGSVDGLSPATRVVPTDHRRSCGGPTRVAAFAHIRSRRRLPRRTPLSQLAEPPPLIGESRSGSPLHHLPQRPSGVGLDESMERKLDIVRKTMAGLDSISISHLLSEQTTSMLTIWRRTPSTGTGHSIPGGVLGVHNAE